MLRHLPGNHGVRVEHEAGLVLRVEDFGSQDELSVHSNHRSCSEDIDVDVKNKSKATLFF